MPIKLQELIDQLKDKPGVREGMERMARQIAGTTANAPRSALWKKRKTTDDASGLRNKRRPNSYVGL